MPEQQDTTTTFGVPSVSKPTPKWAKLAFGIVLLLTTVASFIIGSDQAIDASTTTRILLYLKGVDMFALGLASLFGIEVRKPD